MNWGEELKKIRKNEKFEKFEKFEKSEKFRGNKLSRMKIFVTGFVKLTFAEKAKKRGTAKSFWQRKFLTLKYNFFNK